MKNSIHFSTAEVRGQQIYYCNVSNLATCQLFLPFIIFLNAEADNFIFTNSKILPDLSSPSQQKAAALLAFEKCIPSMSSTFAFHTKEEKTLHLY